MIHAMLMALFSWKGGLDTAVVASVVEYKGKEKKGEKKREEDEGRNRRNGRSGSEGPTTCKTSHVLSIYLRYTYRNHDPANHVVL